MSKMPIFEPRQEWSAAVLDLFPNCAACGQPINATDATERDGNRNRLRHSKECGVVA